MIDLVLIFSILIVSYFANKYITNRKINGTYNIKKNSSFSVLVFICAFVCLVIGVSLEIYFLELISLIAIIVLILNELIILTLTIKRLNKEFRIVLKKEGYTKNVQIMKKEIALVSFKNLFYLLASPFFVLEKCIYYILNTIFK